MLDAVVDHVQVTQGKSAQAAKLTLGEPVADHGQIGVTDVTGDELGRDAQAHTYPLSAALWVGTGSYVIDSSTISSPPVIWTSAPAQRGHTASASVVSALNPQSRQAISAGTVTSSTAAPAASVPSATKLNAWARDSSSTACRTPNRTPIPATFRPPPRRRTVASPPSPHPYSCIPLPDFYAAL